MAGASVDGRRGLGAVFQGDAGRLEDTRASVHEPEYFPADIFVSSRYGRWDDDLLRVEANS